MWAVEWRLWGLARLASIPADAVNVCRRGTTKAACSGVNWRATGPEKVELVAVAIVAAGGCADER